MRSKEYAHDYRYFPEPDLMPMALPRERVACWERELPERPRQRRERLVRQYGIPEYDAGVLAADKAVADYYESAAKLSANPKAVSNWVMTEMRRWLSDREMDIGRVRVAPESLARLVAMVDDRILNSTKAKEVFAALFEEGGRPEDVVQRMGLAQVSDAGAIEALVDQAMAANPQSVEDYRKGKTAALQFLVGQVMRLSRGKANPQIVRQMLDAKLAGPAAR
jgi:aspartyl-tRNA(Asn)/glutamyl-tRNA(Gln) amidotransferase subunit B